MSTLPRKRQRAAVDNKSAGTETMVGTWCVLWRGQRGVVAWEHVTGAEVNNLSKDDGEERIGWNGRHVNAQRRKQGGGC